nr:MAG TPA: hypothetical protein [Bacteriophage sp.]DAY73031.1 MAG TPA: hypothetical protein [Caudoviricetes sp.]
MLMKIALVNKSGLRRSGLFFFGLRILYLK